MECGASVAHEAQQTPAAAAGGRSRKKLFIALGAAGVLVVAAVILVVVLCMDSGKPVTLPYGLNPNMTIYESQAQMEEYGFELDSRYNTDNGITVFYESSLILGYMTEHTSLTHHNDGSYLTVTHSYDDPGYGEGNEGPIFTKIKERLTAEYGMPEGAGYYKWIDGDYMIHMTYIDEDGTFSVSYVYMAGRSE